MPNVLIIGATGSLARYVIDALTGQENTRLTLFARDVKRLPASKGTPFQGDAMRKDDVRKALQQQDIVYVNLAGNLEAMTRNIIEAMQEAHVSRIIAVSSIGIYNQPLRPVLAPYRKMADLIEASGLTYTLLRPDWFTYADEVDYALTRKGQPETGSAVSRKSIAAFVASLVAHPEQYANENLGISKPD